MIHGGPGWSASGWVRCCWRFRWRFSAVAGRPGRDAARSEADAQRQETLIGEQKAELERLRTEIEVLRSGERLSQQATEQSRQTIKLLEDQVFKQQQDIAFYKGVVAPASKADALEIRALRCRARTTRSASAIR